MTRVAMLSMHTSPLAPLGVAAGGGMNVYVRELAGALGCIGVEVDVYAYGHHGMADVVDLRSRVRVHHLEPDPGPIAHVDQVERFTELVRQRLEHSGGTDLIHSHYWLSGMAGHTLKHELEVPLVSTFHTLARVKAESGITTDPDGRAEAEEAIIRCSDTVSVASIVEANEVRRLYNGDAEIDVIAPGIDQTVFQPGDKLAARAELGLSERAPVIVFAGRIQHAKGPADALETLTLVRRSHPNAQLVIIGGPSGPDGHETWETLHHRRKELSFDNEVHFTGALSRHHVARYLQAADVCLVSSHTESFGLVALEAAACGTPVVARAIGGLQVVVQHGETGYLGRSLDDFAGAIEHLLSSSDGSALGRQASRRARSFTWESTARRTKDLYESLLTLTPDLLLATNNCVPA